MRGVIITFDNLSVLVGRVSAMLDKPDRYELELDYEEYVGGNMNPITTTVVFRNQQSKNDINKVYRYADRVRAMNLKEGSIVAATVRFTDASHKMANGYAARYDGIITVKAREEGKRDRNVVIGTVSWARSRTGADGQEYLSMGVYIGKNRNGEYQSVNVNAKDPELIARCKAALLPTDTTRAKAAFRCGEAYTTTGSDGTFQIYHAYDFIKIGMIKR